MKTVGEYFFIFVKKIKMIIWDGELSKRLLATLQTITSSRGVLIRSESLGRDNRLFPLQHFFIIESGVQN